MGEVAARLAGIGRRGAVRLVLVRTRTPASIVTLGDRSRRTTTGKPRTLGGKMGFRARVDEIASVLDTGYTARQFLGKALVQLSAAYDVAKTYQVGPIGEDQTKAGVQYLDGIRIRAEAEYRKIPESSEPLDRNQAQQVAFQIYSIEQATNVTIDVLGGNTALGDLADSMRDSLGNIPDLVPKPPGGWWLWAAAAVALVIIVKAR